MRAVLTGLMIAALVLAGAQGVYAQERPKNLHKFHDRLEWMTMWKLMEALDLDKPTADKVYEIRRKFLGQRKELVREIGAEIQSLRQLLQDKSGNVTDQMLAQKIQTIRQDRKKLDALMDEQFAEVSKILTVRQQAKLVVFIKDFREEIRSMFRRPKPADSPPVEGGFGPPPLPNSPPPLAPGTAPGKPLGGRPPAPGFHRQSAAGPPERLMDHDDPLYGSHQGLE
jgi:hypothetical protein